MIITSGMLLGACVALTLFRVIMALVNNKQARRHSLPVNRYTASFYGLYLLVHILLAHAIVAGQHSLVVLMVCFAAAIGLIVSIAFSVARIVREVNSGNYSNRLTVLTIFFGRIALAFCTLHVAFAHQATMVSDIDDFDYLAVDSQAIVHFTVVGLVISVIIRSILAVHKSYKARVATQQSSAGNGS